MAGPDWRSRLDLTTLALVAAVAVLVGSLVPGPEATGPTDPFVITLGVDKLLHAGGYAVIGAFAAASREWRRRRSLVLLVVAIACFGASVEVAQTLVPGRTATVGDGIANTLGAVVGVLVGVAARRGFHEKSRDSARR